MAVFLQKGGNVSLTKSSPGLNQILIGLGWDARTTAGDDFDLDASAFMLTESGKVKDDKDFIFFNNLICVTLVSPKTPNESNDKVCSNTSSKN